MLELHAVNLVKKIHRNTVKLAMAGLHRREVKAEKRRWLIDRHACDLRESAQKTIAYSRDLQKDAIRDHADRQEHIQSVRDAIISSNSAPK